MREGGGEEYYYIIPILEGSQEAVKIKKKIPLQMILRAMAKD